MALLERLAERIEQRATDIADRTLNAAKIAIAEFPDITLHREDPSTGSGQALVISGRGLMRRWLGDVRLRFAMWRRS